MNTKVGARHANLGANLGCQTRSGCYTSIDRVYSGAPCLVRLFWIHHQRPSRMGRSYWFECPRCGYRAKVAGRADQGLSFAVQTILCRDCRELYDAVTRLRVQDELGGLRSADGFLKARLPRPPPNITTPPPFSSALSRLPPTGVKRFKWLRFEILCPISRVHHVRSWNEPDKCPKCGVFLEKSALPYRLWD